MRDSFSEKMRYFLLCRIPLISSLVLIFVSFVPINSMQINYFRPLVGLICVYYWTLKAKNFFGYVSAFVIGLLTDVYSSSPLGVNMLLMMWVVAFTIWLSRYFQNSGFGVGWFVFGLVSLSVFCLKWLFLMVYAMRILPCYEALFGYFSTVAFYPLITMINDKVQNKFLPSEYINE